MFIIAFVADRKLNRLNALWLLVSFA